jgi:hypothetical protein
VQAFYYAFVMCQDSLPEPDQQQKSKPLMRDGPCAEN